MNQGFPPTLDDLQRSIQNKTAFRELKDYFTIGFTFLKFVEATQPVRIVSPSQTNYIFYQFSESYNHKITRPLNTLLFIQSSEKFKEAFERLMTFLVDLKRLQKLAVEQPNLKQYFETKEINKVIYTIQQSIGCVSDSFKDANQARKRVGQLFEGLIKLIIGEVGLVCEPRTVNLPIPGYPGYKMPYQLDLVFSRNRAIITAETPTFIHTSEIVGSVKTTNKDRIDKIFLDKYLLTQLLGRDIPVVAIFLHDVQRAVKGNSLFGINSTFKTNHFLGYTIALNKLDGVYYVDPRPEMGVNERLREQMRDFQQFLVEDLWLLIER